MLTQVKLSPYMMNGLAHHYPLGKYTVIFRGVRNEFDLGLYCLPMSHKSDARLI